MSIPLYNSATEAATPHPPPHHAIAAVQRCRAAFSQGAANGGKNRTLADQAYREAMPDFTDRASLQDFICCVIRGMNLRVFGQKEGSRLITGARHALSALPPESVLSSEE
ncbi:MAG TPA: hypothetical protein VGL22_09650 [Terracidiphilus sp.]|jgi:hypothetical protein